MTNYILLVILLGFLQIGDLITTEKILQNGKEINPVMNWLFNRFGMHHVLVVKVIIVILIGIGLLQIYPIVLIPLCVLYTGVVSWNSYQIFKGKL